MFVVSLPAETIDPVLEAQYAVVAVQCPCGKTAHGTMSGYNETDVYCLCGRGWRVGMTLDEV